MWQSRSSGIFCRGLGSVSPMNILMKWSKEQMPISMERLCSMSSWKQLFKIVLVLADQVEDLREIWVVALESQSLKVHLSSGTSSSSRWAVMLKESTISLTPIQWRADSLVCQIDMLLKELCHSSNSRCIHKWKINSLLASLNHPVSVRTLGPLVATLLWLQLPQGTVAELEPTKQIGIRWDLVRWLPRFHLQLVWVDLLNKKMPWIILHNTCLRISSGQEDTRSRLRVAIHPSNKIRQFLYSTLSNQVMEPVFQSRILTFCSQKDIFLNRTFMI